MEDSKIMVKAPNGILEPNLFMIRLKKIVLYFVGLYSLYHIDGLVNGRMS